MCNTHFWQRESFGIRSLFRVRHFSFFSFLSSFHYQIAHMKILQNTRLRSGSSHFNLPLQGSKKVKSYIDGKGLSRRSSSAVQNYHLAGVRGGGGAAYGTRSRSRDPGLMLPNTCVMTKDASGHYKFTEKNSRAWGFLVQNKAEPFLLIRHVEDRKTNEPAGYSIGGDPDSAIR